MGWAEETIRKAREAAKAAQAAAIDISESETIKRTKQFANEVATKSRETTDEVLKSKFVETVRDASYRASDKTRQMASDAVDWSHEQWHAATDETNKENWYLRSAKACENVSDAVMGNPDGLSSKISKSAAFKLGGAGASVGIFSVASLLGTASTGTAIGTLSGAAFTGASLAWIGGSIAMGTVIVGAASLAGGIGAVIGASWASQKLLYGKKRELTELEEQERKIVDACLALAVAFRNQAEAGSAIDNVSAKYLYDEAMVPLCDELAELQKKINGWPSPARRRLQRASTKLSVLTDKLKHWSSSNPSVTTGVVSVVFLELLAGDVSSLSSNEALVLDAVRRSNKDLADASDEELANYVQELEPSQLLGLQNNVKGIYHELRFLQDENTDGDSYVAELFEATNHPGADVRIINLETGDAREIQLKATDYLSAIKEHNSRYESVEVFATTEVSEGASGIYSSGMSNEELTADVERVTGSLDDYYDPGVLESMGTAGMVALARNVRVVLKGGTMSNEERQKLIKHGAAAAGKAGLFSLILG